MNQNIHKLNHQYCYSWCNNLFFLASSETPTSLLNNVLYLYFPKIYWKLQQHVKFQSLTCTCHNIHKTYYCTRIWYMRYMLIFFLLLVLLLLFLFCYFLFLIRFLFLVRCCCGCLCVWLFVSLFVCLFVFLLLTICFCLCLSSST